MTNLLNAIDHRKALLANDLRPSDYDQQAALDFINETIIPLVGYDKATTYESVATVTKLFLLGWDRPQPIEDADEMDDLDEDQGAYARPGEDTGL